ncbi:hypothetical protein B0J17DRAFT_679842 [Rhizoctonia solani]|nr:hypothetical protein B0J17DRAFT_679842 [Rhizoctonia solani]
MHDSSYTKSSIPQADSLSSPAIPLASVSAPDFTSAIANDPPTSVIFPNINPPLILKTHAPSEKKQRIPVMEPYLGFVRLSNPYMSAQEYFLSCTRLSGR